MHYQGIITEEMQSHWYKALDKSKNLYFIIVAHSKKVGLINLKDIHQHFKTAEAGIFIGDREYADTMIPILATITLMEFAFDSLGIKILKAKMSSTNEKVIEFNKRIGYQREEYQSDNQFHYYQTDRDAFYLATNGIKETLQKLNSEGYELKIKKAEMIGLGLTPAAFSISGLRLRIEN
jgi:RimJ/RimL family protein N-acetyltransferase